MKIKELIKKLEELEKEYGNLECYTFDSYTANEGWDLKFMDEYEEVLPRYFEETNEETQESKKFILL